MAEKIETGKHAFPTHWQDEIAGMELRDYFAAKALNGVVAANNPKSHTEFQLAALDAYSIADAMLAARGGDRD